MKTAISIPDRLFRAAEEAAERLSMSRSELYTRAVQAFLEDCPAVDVTQKLNEVYSEHSSGLDPGMLEMQRLSLPDDPW
jgi:metal-responsive CopG/Arc/MetJ family transcriptional regulator